jgi:hypothetical protein
MAQTEAAAGPRTLLPSLAEHDLAEAAAELEALSH